MREQIEQWIQHSLAALSADGRVSTPARDLKITESGDKAHGDWACSVALSLAKGAGMSPRDLAGLIVEHLPEMPGVERVEIAGPGFINFFVGSDVTFAGLRDLLAADWSSPARDESRPSVLIEFVSANPTGPLHVGHGRGAAYGACLAALFERLNWRVECEYYVNDAGRQIDVLTLSVWLRYLALGDGPHAAAGNDDHFPHGAYSGDYIWDVAAECRREHADGLESELKDGFPERPEIPETDKEKTDEEKNAETEAREAHLTRLIGLAKSALGDEFDLVRQRALKTLREMIERELNDFGVRFDSWFFEHAATKRVDEVLALLKKVDALYEEDGAVWFRSSQFGDTKDRVLVRSDGQATYFVTDVAYHLDKYRRGYDRMINIWGADHHGYVARLTAALRAIGLDIAKLDIILVQFVNLMSDGVRASMSTRSGEFVPLRELCDEVGVDAARFFYVERKPSRHMDFDLDLAKASDNENPLYYVQYAHARICSVFRQLDESAWSFDADTDKDAPLNALDRDDEREIIRMTTQYPGVLREAGNSASPHHLTRYLHTLAGVFHAYYNDCRFIVDDEAQRNARLLLITAVRKVIADGLRLIGVAAPDKM